MGLGKSSTRSCNFLSFDIEKLFEIYKKKNTYMPNLKQRIHAYFLIIKFQK